MNPLLHSIRLYLSRFRWEIALLWLASASLSAAALAGSGEAVTSRLAPLELVFLGIVIIRFAMAEDVFGTTGGWRIRPLEGRTLFRARMLSLLVAVLPPVLFRLGVWMWTANPTGWNFLELLWNDGLPVVVLIGGFLLLVRLARQWVAREAAGVALLVIGPALLLVVFLWLSHAAARKGGNFGVASRKDIPPALAEAMPAGSHFLGKIRQGNTERVDRIATLPLLPGTYEMGARKAMIKHVGMVDDRLELVMGFQSLRTVSSTRNLIFVVRYSDGSYATGGESSGTAGDVRFWLFKVRGETRRAIYESPLSLPWNRRSWAELLGGAELMVFERREPFFDRRMERPASLIRSELIYLHAEGEVPRDFVRRSVNVVGADRMPELLAWPTWSGVAWEKMVHPFLMRNTTDANREAVESRFRKDPRIARVLWQKGWREPVIAELTQRLKARRPLEVRELGLIAELDDPTLSEDLSRAFIEAKGEWPWLLDKLRGHPGIDPTLLVLRAWKQVETADAPAHKKERFATWAAAEGDASAMRYLALRGEREWIGRHVLSYGRDPIDWLAEEGDRMTFDPERKVFVEGN